MKIYYHTDHLGTPVMLTDANQQTAWDATYDPFGKASITTASITNNLRFLGQYYDTETGLHYNWHRYYWPEVGRYVQFDPLLFYSYYVSSYLENIDSDFSIFELLEENEVPFTYNGYSYAINNPILFFDSTGLVAVINLSGEPVSGSGNPGFWRGHGDPIHFMIPPDCKFYGIGNPIPGTGVTDIDYIAGRKYRGTSFFPIIFIYKKPCSNEIVTSYIPLLYPAICKR